MTRAGRWRRLRYLGAELIIVIVGVIIALAIEAWWSDRRDQARAGDHLVALHADFTANLDALNGNLASLHNIQGAVGQLLAVMVNEAARPSPDSLVSLTWMAFSFPPFEPLTTAYDNLISTGDIALLRDEQLKRDLASFKSAVEVYRRSEWQLDQWNRVIQQYVASGMSPLDWLPTAYRESRGLPDPLTRTDWDAVLGDREFEGILANRVLATDNNIIHLNRVLPAARRIVARLGALLELEA